jgi:hypothetical protein
MTEHAPLHSPLDSYLARFLHEVGTRDGGYQPGLESMEVADALDVPRAFVNALFTSAQTRGLLKPIYGRGATVRWAVSPTGHDLVNRSDQQMSDT